MAGDGPPRPRPSRTAIAVLAVVSIAIPAALLALILPHDSNSTSSSSVPAGTPTTLENPIDSSRARDGSPAPAFALRATDGRSVSLASLRGKPVVLAFFASWCH